MLQIIIPEREFYDEVNNRFVKKDNVAIKLEHSLVSVAKWESKWHKPFISTFLSQNQCTAEMFADYVRCMTVTQNVDPMVFYYLTPDNKKTIISYINDPMTATWFSDKNQKKNRDIITAEIIYYWMVALQIPFECQKWHLNRLLTLIQVCNIKNKPPKKMNKRSQYSQNSSINAARRKAMNSKG